MSANIKKNGKRSQLTTKNAVKERFDFGEFISYIWGIFSYAIFVFLILVGSVLLIYFLDIKIRQSKGDYSPSKYNAYVVLTGSMEPSIMVNDVVVTKQKDVSELKIGDVITFVSSDPRFSGFTITHRISDKYIENKEYVFKTKGDGNNVADQSLVYKENIIGKVIFKVPKLGYIQYFLAERGGWIVSILILAIAVVSYDIMKLFKNLIKK